MSCRDGFVVPVLPGTTGAGVPFDMKRMIFDGVEATVEVGSNR